MYTKVRDFCLVTTREPEKWQIYLAKGRLISKSFSYLLTYPKNEPTILSSTYLKEKGLRIVLSLFFGRLKPK